MSLELREKIAAPPILRETGNAHVQALFTGKQLDKEEMQKIRDCRRVALRIGTKCALSCDYCVSNMFLPEVQQCSTVVDELGVDEYLKRVLYLVEPIIPDLNFTISGGEPSENPHFVQIATELFKTGAMIHLQTNVHGIANIEKFTSQFPKSEIEKRVHATVSFHCGAYIDKGEKGAKWRDLWVNDWFPRLVATGIQIPTVVVPMTPKVLFDPQFPAEYDQILKLSGCNPTVTELFHFYAGKHYPESYTPEESRRLAELQTQFMHYSQKVRFDQEVIPCKANPAKMQYLTNYLELKGLPCAVSTHNLEILMDGEIRECQSFPQETTAKGNLKDPNYKKLYIAFTENVYPCPADQCFCRAFGVAYSLQLYQITLDEYYKAWYNDQNKPEVAKHFE